MTHGKTYNKSPRRINNKATKSKTNTGTTALERSVEQTTGGFKALLQLANFTLGPDATLNTELHKNSVRIKVYFTAAGVKYGVAAVNVSSYFNIIQMIFLFPLESSRIL